MRKSFINLRINLLKLLFLFLIFFLYSCANKQKMILKAIFPLLQTPASSVNTLKSITSSSGSLIPVFSSTTYTYSVSVTNSINTITITPTLTDMSATISINGISANSGVASSPISLNIGLNTITITITAQNQSVLVYTINITRLNANIYRFFLTSVTHNGNFGGISGADTFCNADANNPDTTVSFKAFLADNVPNRAACNTTANCTLASENVNWVLKPSANYIRSSDNLALFTATSTSAIFSFGNFSNSFSSGSQEKIWTGLRSGWDSSSFDCNHWASSSSSKTAAYGLSDATDSNAIRDGGSSVQTCDLSYRILCVEQ